MIKNKIEQIYNTWTGKYLLFPLLLIFVWIFLTLLYIINFDTSFSIWSYNHPNGDLTKITFDPLYKGSEIAGQFKARDDNLGIVSIRFQTFIRPPYEDEDVFLFRIKEKDSKTWYYQNTYKSGLIYDVPFFPFGFPQISNSKGKTYVFDIISLKGNPINSIEISNRSPILVSKYKYSGQQLIQNKKELIRFSTVKIVNALQNPDVWFSSIIYFLPFLFYLFLITTLGEKLISRSVKYLRNVLSIIEKIPVIGRVVKLTEVLFVFNFDFVIIAVVLLDILVYQLTNDMVYIIVILLWIVVLKEYKKGSVYTFILAFLILLLTPIFLFFKEGPTAEKASIWSFIFFIAAIVHAYTELDTKPEILDSRLGK